MPSNLKATKRLFNRFLLPERRSIQENFLVPSLDSTPVLEMGFNTSVKKNPAPQFVKRESLKNIIWISNSNYLKGSE
jgi:hypothetical protein